MDIRLDPSNPYQEHILTDEDLKMAFMQNPALIAVLQNKISAYAKDLINAEPIFDADPKKQFHFMKHQLERRAQVRVLEEFMGEMMAGMAKTLELNAELNAEQSR